MTYITKGVAKLTKPESISVCLWAVTRNGEIELLKISKKVASELIASDFGLDRGDVVEVEVVVIER